MYHDLLSKVKNAGFARKESVLFPYSKADFAIAKILAKSGYVKEAQKKTINRKNFIEVKIGYEGKEPILKKFKVMSKASRRIYAGYQELKPVKNGYGLGVLSTSKGIMTVGEAKKSKLGGEYLFEIW